MASPLRKDVLSIVLCCIKNKSHIVDTADWEQPSCFTTFHDDPPSRRRFIILLFVLTDMFYVGAVNSW